MTELPITYLKELATQLIFISAFLGGFSATILGTLITSKNDNKTLKVLILGSALSAVSFIVAVFAMTQLVMISIPGYPIKIDYSTTVLPRTIGTMAFFAGILSLIFVISAAGWLYSKRLGIATTIIGAIGLIFIIMATAQIG